MSPDTVFLPAFGHELVDPLGEQAGGPGVFGPAVAVPCTASETDRFLTWTGRPLR